MRDRCFHGHVLHAGNRYVTRDGRVRCRACHATEQARYRRRLRAKRTAAATAVAAANKRARTTCTRGHDFTDINTYWTPDGKRRCRRCHADRVQYYRLFGPRYEQWERALFEKEMPCTF